MELNKDELWTALTEPMTKKCENCKHYLEDRYCGSVQRKRYQRDHGVTTCGRREWWEWNGIK